MNPRTGVILIGFAVVVTACASTRGDRISRAPAQQWHGKIYVGGPAEGGDHYVANASTTRLASDRIRTTVTVRGDLPSGSYPWHIHVGTCADGSSGPIVGDPDAYPPLQPGQEGVHTATANLGVSLDPDGSYYVNIHASEEAMTTILACGRLERG